MERIETEKRDLKNELKDLEDIQQKYRLLEMKNLQLTQSEKCKNAEIEDLNKEIMGNKNKLKRTSSHFRVDENGTYK